MANAVGEEEDSAVAHKRGGFWRFLSAPSVYTSCNYFSTVTNGTVQTWYSAPFTVP
jgi:hypothetical protein